MGTGGAASLRRAGAGARASGTELVTVALRRIDPPARARCSPCCERSGIRVLPNTAGCFTAGEAVLTARLAREAFDTDWVKLEVIGDERTLLPDPVELLDAAEAWSTTASPCCRTPTTTRCWPAGWRTSGCAAVMPLGAPIGSGLGIRNPHNFRADPESGDVPVILDAGIGTASDAALAMELGCDGVLLASAVTRAQDPALMARDAARGRGRPARPPPPVGSPAASTPSPPPPTTEGQPVTPPAARPPSCPRFPTLPPSPPPAFPPCPVSPPVPPEGWILGRESAPEAAPCQSPRLVPRRHRNGAGTWGPVGRIVRPQ